MKTEAEQIAGLVAALQSVPSLFQYDSKEQFVDAWFKWLEVRAIALIHAGASFDMQGINAAIAKAEGHPDA